MDVRQYIEAHAEEFFGSLSQWLAIPSISADPAPSETMSPGPQPWLQTHLQGTGFPIVEVWATGEAYFGRDCRLWCMPNGRPPTRPRRSCWSTASLTTCSRSSRSRSGTVRPSSRCSATVCCLAAGLPTTRDKCCFMRLACARAWPQGANTLPAGDDEAADRGRGGVGLAAFRRPAAQQARPAGVRCHRGVGYHDVGGGRAVRVRACAVSSMLRSA